MIYYIFSRKKTKEGSLKISQEYSFSVILTRSSQYGLFVNYMLIFASPAHSVS